MKSDKVEILLSTYGERIFDVLEKAVVWASNAQVLIVHQELDTNVQERAFDLIKTNRNITYIPTKSYGVAKSRNLALENATGDILLFCDDDIELVDDFYEQLKRSFYSNPTSAAITFAVKDPISGKLTKRFPLKRKQHNKKTILGVGTIEVAVRKDAVVKAGVFFPEDLGAGSEYPLCDEPVFLSRLLNKNCKVTYEPVVIALHPIDSSGRLIDTYNKLKSRYIAFEYIFGKYFGKIVFIIFSIKNLSRIDSLSWVVRCFVSR